MPPKKAISTTKSATTTEKPDNEDESVSVSPPEAEASDANANLDAILSELRQSRRENSENFRALKDDIATLKTCIGEVETRVCEIEDRTMLVEEAMAELAKLYHRLEAKQIDIEGQSRRNNIRIYGVPEGDEEGSRSVSAFVEDLLINALFSGNSVDLAIERAHRSLGPKPPPDAAPRSILVKLASYKMKDEVLRLAWQKRGFTYKGKRVSLDQDYTTEVLKRRREYNEVKRVLKEKSIRFQTPYPAKLRVFFEGETRVYNSAEEATKDMVQRGFSVSVIQTPISLLDKTMKTMWQKVKEKKTKEAPAASQEGFKMKLAAFRKT